MYRVTAAYPFGHEVFLVQRKRKFWFGWSDIAVYLEKEEADFCAEMLEIGGL